VGGDLPQAIHNLEETSDGESRAGLRVPHRRRPPAHPHELLHVRDAGVAVAEKDIQAVDAGQVDKHEELVTLLSGGAAVSRRVPKLNGETQIGEATSLKVRAIPLLMCAVSCLHAV
jgi:hypothetical protein